MRNRKTAASFVLALFLVSSVPVFAAPANRDRGRDPGQEIGPIQRVVQLIKRIVKPLDEISIPRP